MKKKDYRPEIHALFEKKRIGISVQREFDIRRLQLLDEFEERLLKENSHVALREALEFFDMKKKIYVLPLSKKKYTVFPSGKIKTEVLS